jgi:hypothetical protein
MERTSLSDRIRKQPFVQDGSFRAAVRVTMRGLVSDCRWDVEDAHVPPLGIKLSQHLTQSEKKVEKGR